MAMFNLISSTPDKVGMKDLLVGDTFCFMDVTHANVYIKVSDKKYMTLGDPTTITSGIISDYVYRVELVNVSYRIVS